MSSDRYGTVTLGRQYTSVKDYVGHYGFALAYGGSTTETPGDIDDVNDTFRLNNAIKYVSPDLNGLTFGGMVSLGGAAGQVSQASAYNFGASYEHGPLSMGAGYELFKNPSAVGGILNDNVNAASFNSLNAGYLAPIRPVRFRSLPSAEATTSVR